ncbi:lymphotactin-like [Dromiciops gliroides]|uniref:lymphotactin-like n=1 Tax=Dromiciops gliroides TaxID=33562 RepID=UPI001CC6A949|nr:lymphotactin-like [Dromiciops gliroides]
MKLLLLALFCFCGLTAYIAEGVGSEVPQKGTCLSWGHPLQSKRVKSYTIEEGPIKAVIFITHKGFKICADPEANWVKNVIKSVQSRTNMKKTTSSTV